MHRHFTRNLERFQRVHNQTKLSAVELENNDKAYLSDSTLSSDETFVNIATNAHQLLANNRNACKDTAEIIVDTAEGPLDNGTDTIVCTNCIQTFRGKKAYDTHVCRTNLPDDYL